MIVLSMEDVLATPARILITTRTWVQLGPINVSKGSKGSETGCQCRLVSFSYNLQTPFHGGNTGSNPVGDAN